MKLFFLQVIDDKYKTMADNNALRFVTQYPARGKIYDRNGKLLVYNQPAYDLVVTMREVKDLDTLDLCNTLGITREVFEERMREIMDPRRNKGYSSYTQQTFVISASTKRETLCLKPFSLLMRNLNFYAKHMNQGSLSVSSLSAQVIQKSTFHASQKDILKVGTKSQYQRLYHDTTNPM